MRRIRVRYILILFIVAYATFVCIYNHHQRLQVFREMMNHAVVVEDDVWTLSPGGSAAYLSLAAARDNYTAIAIQDMSDRNLLTIDGPELAGLNLLGEQAGLFPRTVITADIKHNGRVIGRLIGHHRNMNVYIHFFASVVFGLVLLAIVLFLKTVQAKREIEQRVFERTAELRNEIEERNRVTEALRKSEERFQYAMHATKDGLWDWDIPGDNVYLSPGYYSILGYEPDEISMTTQEWRECIDPIDRDKTLQTYADCIENRTEHFQVEFRMSTKTGDGKWILCRGRAVDRDNNGRALRLVGTHADITERKLAEKERHQLEAQLQRSEKMELVGTLAGGVAHDLNNILGAIVGYPDLLIEKMSHDDPMRMHLTAIKESGERAALIVQDLLTLARRGVPVTEPENLNHITTRYLESRPFLKLKQLHPNVVVETQLDQDLFNILGSQVHLTKAVMNLCNNAVEAMPAGGTLLISTENAYLDRPVRGYDRIEEGSYVLFAVKDDGVGISESDLKRIFEPFYSKKVMGTSGTGLGMAVVWGTVKDHNGYIDVTSQEGIGTTFKLYFPVTNQMVQERRTPVPIDRMIGNGEKILIIDDVEEQRLIAVNLLKRLNYSVADVKSGEDAVEYLRHQSADLLVLDMIMEPGMDGLETYRRIAQIHPGQRAIITSGFSETERVIAAQKLGAGQYIKKPYTLEKLGLAVKHEISRDATDIPRPN